MESFERQVIDRLSAIERGQLDLYRQLFGNGQPGLMQNLQRRVEEHERFKDRLIATTGIVSGLVSFVVGTLFTLHDHLFGHR